MKTIILNAEEMKKITNEAQEKQNKEFYDLREKRTLKIIKKCKKAAKKGNNFIKINGVLYYSVKNMLKDLLYEIAETKNENNEKFTIIKW